jgi:hypothetical protein
MEDGVPKRELRARRDEIGMLVWRDKRFSPDVDAAEC